MARRLQHRAVVLADLQHLLKGGLSGLGVTGAGEQGADFRAHPRAHRGVARAGQRPMQQPCCFERLPEVLAELDEATAQTVVARIAGYDRAEQLERARRDHRARLAAGFPAAAALPRAAGRARS